MRSAVSASDIWSVLHGVVCVHKPRDVSLTSLKKILVSAICSDANECIPPPRVPTIKLPIVEPHPKSQALVIVGMRKQLDYRYVDRLISDSMCFYRFMLLKALEIRRSLIIVIVDTLPLEHFNKRPNVKP
uniref:Uncharacterized protein n=1 Tax=Parascaris equorum TaxID=6256 RepID=A0A914REF5_PAREQ